MKHTHDATDKSNLRMALDAMKVNKWFTPACRFLTKLHMQTLIQYEPFLLVLVHLSVTLTLKIDKDGNKSSKAKHHDRHLVAGCSMCHKFHTSIKFRV